jgi:hypothetical protein
VPRANEAFAGVIASDTSAGGPTVNVAEPAMVPTVAVIVVLPCPAPDASPPLLTPATVGVDELQVAEPVRSCVLLSLYVPVALYCCDVPSAMAAVAGLTAIDIRTGAVTVKVVEPAIDPEVAVIVAAPCLMLVANPPLLTLATPGTLEVHVTELVKFCVVPSLYVPVAVNC